MHNLAVALDPCRRLLGNHLSPPFPRPRLVPKRAARPNAEGLTQASRLVAALREAGSEPATYVVTNAGHSATERENALALTAIMDGLPPLR